MVCMSCDLLFYYFIPAIPAYYDYISLICYFAASAEMPFRLTVVILIQTSRP